MARFYKGSLPIVELPQQPVDQNATIRQLEQLAGEHRRLYGVYRASETNDPQGIVDGWLRTHTAASADQWLGNVRVVTYAVPHSTDDWPVQDVAPASMARSDCARSRVPPRASRLATCCSCVWTGRR